jgi:hypothetical protein
MDSRRCSSRPLYFTCVENYGFHPLLVFELRSMWHYLHLLALVAGSILEGRQMSASMVLGRKHCVLVRWTDPACPLV